MKSPGVAAVLCFFYCGLGQIYNGQIAKGILLFCAYSLSLGLMLVLIGFVLAPLLWIYGMYDAYSTAEAHNRRSFGVR